MKFFPAPNILDESYFDVRTSENGSINIAVFPVMYGYRVVGWRTGDCGCSINWCGGDSQDNVERLYAIALNILQQRDEDVHAFDGIPFISNIKPFFLDVDFCKEINALTTEKVEPVTLTPLHEIRSMLYAANPLQGAFAALVDGL